MKVFACFSFLAFVGISGTDAAAATAPVLDCTVVSAIKQTVCQTGTFYTPSPASINGVNILVGSFTYIYDFWQGLPNGTDTSAGTHNAHKTGVQVTVDRVYPTNVCTVTTVANGVTKKCKSCVYCDPTTESYTADCTNVPYGRNVTCELVSPVFYPFSKTPQAIESVGTDNLTSLAEKCKTMLATKAKQCKKTKDLTALLTEYNQTCKNTCLKSLKCKKDALKTLKKKSKLNIQVEACKANIKKAGKKVV
jgi:hypothetical protein